MPQLLRLDSSISDDSRTRHICDAFEQVWSDRGTEYTTVTRDLVAQPLPHFDSAALHWPERLRGGATANPELEALQQSALSDLAAADVLLIGAPMYNFSMPSQLKAWIDLIHVTGLTSPFDSDTQPFKGKIAFVVSARGSAYDPGSPAEAMDHVIPPLRLILENSLGIAVHPIVTNRTIAERMPALDVNRANEELTAAIALAREQAARVLDPEPS